MKEVCFVFVTEYYNLTVCVFFSFSFSEGTLTTFIGLTALFLTLVHGANTFHMLLLVF